MRQKASALPTRAAATATRDLSMVIVMYPTSDEGVTGMFVFRRKWPKKRQGVDDATRLS